MGNEFPVSFPISKLSNSDWYLTEPVNSGIFRHLCGRDAVYCTGLNQRNS